MSAAIPAQVRSLVAPRAFIVAVSVLLMLAGAMASLGIGAVDVTPRDLLALIRGWLLTDGADTVDPLTRSVVLDLRGPRTVLAVLTGAALAVSGAAFQGLFRNPLADPSLIGISAGAATGAVTFIVLGGALPLLGSLPAIYALPLCAAAGALLAAGGIFVLGTRAGSMDVATLLLAGIAINALCSAASGLLIFASDDQQLRELTFWSMGSLARAHWTTLWPAVPWIAFAVGGLLLLANATNALALGEAEAAYLGYRVERLKGLIVLCVAAAVGGAVAMSGVIVFVGLIVPHTVRMLLGADNRYVFPASAFAGASLLLVADCCARTVVLPAELPIGLLTSLIGGPFFLWLMSRREARVGAP